MCNDKTIELIMTDMWIKMVIMKLNSSSKSYDQYKYIENIMGWARDHQYVRWFIVINYDMLKTGCHRRKRVSLYIYGKLTCTQERTFYLTVPWQSKIMLREMTTITLSIAMPLNNEIYQHLYAISSKQGLWGVWLGTLYRYATNYNGI